MKHLLLFESYISSIHEMDLGDPRKPWTPGIPGTRASHYLERTSLDHPISRVVPHSENYKSGFKVEIFVDDKNKIHNFNVVQDALGIDENTINRYISSTLNMLTNSKKINDWNPKNKKPEQSIDLGRICFKIYSDKYYPVIQASDRKGGFYNGGDNIWLIAKENTKAKTLKYYESSPKGRTKMYNDSLGNYNKSYEEFIEDHAYGYPYGQNSSVVIDLTDDDDESIVMERVRNQIENR